MITKSNTYKNESYSYELCAWPNDSDTPKSYQYS